MKVTFCFVDNFTILLGCSLVLARAWKCFSFFHLEKRTERNQNENKFKLAGVVEQRLVYWSNDKELLLKQMSDEIPSKKKKKKKPLS